MAAFVVRYVASGSDCSKSNWLAVRASSSTYVDIGWTCCERAVGDGGETVEDEDDGEQCGDVDILYDEKVYVRLVCCAFVFIQ